MEKIFLEVLDIIGKSKLNDYILLIGSWSEFLYEECNVIRGFVSNIKTGDIDFLIGNVNKPRESIDIISEFQKQDFVIEMAANKVYRIFKGEFEIEFLTVMKGGTYRFKPVPSLELPNVQALTHIGMLLIDFIQVEFKKHQISIPNPYNYILHKMIINDKRKEKIEKDKRAIANLLIHLDTKEDDASFEYYYNLLSKKEKKTASTYVVENNLNAYFQFLL